MKKKTWHSFVKNHNLVNRIYDMLDYFHCFDEVKNVELAKNQIKNKIRSIYYVETLAKYFDDKKNKHIKNIELRCNLIDLINDLDYLKQYGDVYVSEALKRVGKKISYNLHVGVSVENNLLKFDISSLINEENSFINSCTSSPGFAQSSIIILYSFPISKKLGTLYLQFETVLA